MSLRDDAAASTRPRVLLLTEVFPPRQGGSGRWLWELYRRLTAIDVKVLASATAGHESFDQSATLDIERLSSALPSWGVLTLAGARGYLAARRQVRRTAAAWKPSAIHCGKCLPEGLVAIVAGRGLPVSCYAHGEELTLAETSRELRSLTRFVLGRAARVIANSRHTRGLLVDRWKVPEERVTVLTPGVDTDRFVPARPDPDIRARLGWTGRRVILTVGALQKRKGQDMLIRALPAIRRQCPDVLYAIVGEGWEQEDLRRLAREVDVEEAVMFQGVSGEEDLVRCFQQCDLFALPNRQVGWDFEGFGIVLLEAQSCGRAVVTGTSGGTGETMIPGETGEQVACDAPEPLAAACIGLLDDPERRLAFGARGREWVVSRFDWKALAAEATTLFDGRAQPPGRPSGLVYR